MSVSTTQYRPLVVVFAAFTRDGDDPDETTWWTRRFAFDQEMPVAGLREPLKYDSETDVALCVTGIGHVEAATTVAALVAAPAFDFSETYFVTVGVAGTPPERGTIGSVFVADALVDWDQKYRVDHDGDTRLSVFPFKSDDELCKRLNPTLVALAETTASGVSLADSAVGRLLRTGYTDSTAARTPFVGTGTSVSGSEFWHGNQAAAWADHLCDHLDVSPYCTTEMEGFATASVLDRFGHLDRYLSIRAVSNFDRPWTDADASTTLTSDEAGLALAVENAFRVASAVVDRLVAGSALTADSDPARLSTDPLRVVE